MKQLYSHLFNYFWPLASVICLKKELNYMKDMDGKIAKNYSYLWINVNLMSIAKSFVSCHVLKRS